jgi:hypothetical protein
MPLAPHTANQGPINPLGIGLKFSHRHSNLDVESTIPQGGPQNFPTYNHQHLFTPHNTYLNFSTPGGNGSGTHPIAAAQESDFGILDDQILPQNIFKDGTGLDIENPGPGNSGGPNRANAGATNIPTGQYQTNTPSGPLTDDNGAIINNTVHQYLPNSNYKDSFPAGALAPNTF